MMMKKNFTQKWAFIRLLYAFSVESTFAWPTLVLDHYCEFIFVYFWMALIQSSVVVTYLAPLLAGTKDDLATKCDTK